ncbi:cytochrome P450 [Schizophyllum commune]
MIVMNPFTFSAIGGLACHLIFNRFEPQDLTSLITLLLLVPSGLSTLFRLHSSIPVSILLAFTTYLGTLLCSIVLYRLSPFHPLAGYPGPILCKITKLYSAWISLGGKQHFHYRRLHEKYGDVVRVGPNELAFFTADAIEPLFGSAGLPKGTFWDGRVGRSEENRTLVAIHNKKEHGARRKKWQRAFTPSALKVYEPIIRKRVAEFVDTLACSTGALSYTGTAQPVNLCEKIAYFAWDFMFDLAYGGGSAAMQKGDVDGMLHLQDVVQKPLIFRSHMPWLGDICGTLARFFPSRVHEFRMWAIGVAAARVRKGSPYEDIFYHLADEGGVSKEKPAFPEIVADGVLAVTAGSDTTSTALSVIFYFLMSHPTAYRRLQREIDEQGDDLYDYRRQAEMPYLNAVINEAMRLIPPVPEGSHRMVREKAQAKVVAGSYVPPGTQTFVPQYTLFRDWCNFSPLPDSFVPERWLSEEDRIRLEPDIFTKSLEPFNLNRAAFIPFSHGPANCVGKQLAYMEMRMLLCAILRRFDLRFADGWDPKEWEDGLQGFFVMVKGKMPVVVSERRGAGEK